MSCLSAKVSVFNEHISANAVTIDENIRARAVRIAGISAFADIISENIHATAKTINEGIKATCSLNGDAPSQALKMLHNGQMITNETLLVDTSVIIIKELENSTRMLNKYYLKN